MFERAHSYAHHDVKSKSRQSCLSMPSGLKVIAHILVCSIKYFMEYVNLEGECVRRQCVRMMLCTVGALCTKAGDLDAWPESISLLSFAAANSTTTKKRSRG